jgi:Ca2+-binding EF-hand superfamily protein
MLQRFWQLTLLTSKAEIKAMRPEPEPEPEAAKELAEHISRAGYFELQLRVAKAFGISDAEGMPKDIETKMKDIEAADEAVAKAKAAAKAVKAFKAVKANAKKAGHKARLKAEARVVAVTKAAAAVKDGIAEQWWNDAIERFDPAAAKERKLSLLRSRLLHDIVHSKTTTRFGWGGLFALYDANGDGEVDMHEFLWGCRDVLGFSPDSVNNDELEQLFDTIEFNAGTGRGCIDQNEFQTWVQKELKRIEEADYFTPEQKLTWKVTKALGNVSATPMSWKTAREMNQLSRSDDVVLTFVEAAEMKVTELGWFRVFETGDVDGCGAMDQVEFRKLCRDTCGLKTSAISDDELEWIFRTASKDGQTISADGFYVKLTATSPLNMSYDAFAAALYSYARAEMTKRFGRPACGQILSQLFGIVSLPTAAGLVLGAPHKEVEVVGPEATGRYKFTKLSDVTLLADAKPTTREPTRRPWESVDSGIHSPNPPAFERARRGDRNQGRSAQSPKSQHHDGQAAAPVESADQTHARVNNVMERSGDSTVNRRDGGTAEHGRWRRWTSNCSQDAVGATDAGNTVGGFNEVIYESDGGPIEIPVLQVSGSEDEAQIELQVGPYPIVTSQYSSTTLYHFPDHIYSVAVF